MPKDLRHVKLVVVSLDSYGRIIVDPDPVRISHIAGEEVVWYCEQGDLEIVFPSIDECPFERMVFSAPKNGASSSGRPVRHQQRLGETRSFKNEYKYTARIYVGGNCFEKDPVVIVEP